MRAAVFVGKYLQGKDALSLLGQESKLYGQRPFLIIDSFVEQVLGQKITAQFNTNISKAIFGGECCDPEIDRLSEAAKDHDVVIGVGGGKHWTPPKSLRTVSQPTASLCRHLLPPMPRAHLWRSSIRQKVLFAL